jgi:hypothetical protein
MKKTQVLLFVFIVAVVIVWLTIRRNGAASPPSNFVEVARSTNNIVNTPRPERLDQPAAHTSKDRTTLPLAEVSQYKFEGYFKTLVNPTTGVYAILNPDQLVVELKDKNGGEIWRLKACRRMCEGKKTCVLLRSKVKNCLSKLEEQSMS